MAEEETIRGQQDNNLRSRSGDISSQLSVILDELSSVKQEVQGTNINVASEVKKTEVGERFVLEVCWKQNTV